MKFTCNNCGFSASIPTEQYECPMCGSTDVSCLKENKTSLSPIEPPHEEEPPHPHIIPSPSEETAPQQQATQKPTENSDEDLVKMLQEIEEEKSVDAPSAPPSNNNKRTILIVAVIILLLGVAALAFFGIRKMKIAEENAAQLVQAIEDEKALQQEKDEQKMRDEIKEEEEKIEKEMAQTENKIEEEIDKEKSAEEKALALEKRKRLKKRRAYLRRRRANLRKKKNSAKAPVETAPIETAPAPVKLAPAPVETAPAPVKLAPAPVETAPVPVVAKKPNFMDLTQLGKMALANKKYKDAVVFFTQAKKINPGIPSIYKYLGIAYASQGKSAKACTQYRQYILLAPSAKDKAQIEQALQGCK